jgi:hypothetical protein
MEQLTEQLTTHSRVIAVDVERPWTAFFLPVEQMPFRETRTALRATLTAVRNRVQEAGGLHLEVLLQFNQLHHGDAAELMRVHVRQWLPVVGQGIYPDQPPPTSWTPDDFRNLDQGELPRPLMHPLIHLSGEAQERVSAADEMFGFGANVEVLAAADSDSLLQQCAGPLVEPIRDPVFLGYPFYFPLLSVKSVENAARGDLAKWLPGIALYMRESPEDGGVLILSAGPLDADLLGGPAAA